jgi:hypothetical protein
MVAGTRDAEGVEVLDVPSARSSETGSSARGDDMKEPEVLGVVVPPGEFRTPRAVVAVRCGDVVVRVTVRRLSRSRLDVLPPWAGDGSPGVEMPRAVWEAMEAAALAAVQADGYAALVMMAPRRRVTVRPENCGKNDGNP